MKKWKKILAITVAVIVGLFLIKDTLIKGAITTVGSQVVGAPIKIKKFSLGLFSQKVHIKGFQLYNPKGYPDESMVDINEITVAYSLPALMGGKLHLPLIVFDLNEVVIIKDKEGALNVESLKIVQAQDNTEDEARKQKEAKSTKKTEPLAMQIDLMRLNISRVVVKDLGKDPVLIEVHDTGFKDKEFEDITSAEEMAMRVMWAATSSAGIKSAAMYAAATVLGMGLLPVGIAGVLLSDDDTVREYASSLDDVFNQCLALLGDIGEVKSEDRQAGVIKGKIHGTDVTLEINTNDNKKTSVKVSARKKMLPKQSIAAGVLYQLSKRIK